MLNCADIMIRIVNYDDMVGDCQSIIEVCHLLEISPQIRDEWVSEYLSQNLKIEV